MKRLLEQLQSDEAVLLMYLAGELPDAEQAEVEGRLESDAKLRAELERIREMQAGVITGLAQLDESSRLLGGQDLAVKRVGGMMRQWQVDRIRAAASNGNGHRKLPIWKMSSAAAAILLIGWVAWWGMTPSAPMSDPTNDLPERMSVAEVVTSSPQVDVMRQMDEIGAEIVELDKRGDAANDSLQ